MRALVVVLAVCVGLWVLRERLGRLFGRLTGTGVVTIDDGGAGP